MAEEQQDENGLFAIDVDADDYAETAAGDTPSVSRTYQSKADFQAVKAGYQAKMDGGTAYMDLITAVPVLGRSDVDEADGHEVTNGHAKVKLSKKDFQLLGYAVGEMYYDKQYEKLLELCSRLRARCEVDGKTLESLERWEARCRNRMG